MRNSTSNSPQIGHDASRVVNTNSINQNYEIIGLAFLFILCAIPIILLIFACLDWIKCRITKSPRRRWLMNAAISANIIFAVSLVDAFFIEPGLLTTTRINISRSANQSSAGEIKIIHISDIHYEKDIGLTRKLLAEISNEKPDLICITGDIYQMGEYDDAGFKSFMTGICDIAPTYFVCGYDDERTIINASSGKIHYAGVKSLKLKIYNNTVEIAGMPDNRSRKNSPAFSGNSDFKIILNHLPDRLDEASLMKADLFLAGHTHGGQIRLPFWGAVITNCETERKYEYGLYRKDNMNAFVTRGIGMEPKPAPQARFLCPPEVVVITVQ